ncbi:MAG: chromosomal replication initiator protein DnaA [Spirochaetales bacterium]|nr:chromosomal replication initiator protein DnaA [Spirochaetales bacterium]
MSSYDFSIFWKESIKQLKDEKLISNQEFDMWFTNINYVGSSESSITVSVPSNFYKDQVIQRYLDILENKLLELSGRKLKIDFEIIQKTESVQLRKEEPAKVAPSEPEQSQKISEHVSRKPHPQLREDYTFENFIIGNNNEFAANAAKGIAENPGSNYNPCLIYGGVGMGKTHLMQSIGNSIFKKNDGKKIVFISAETFVSEFVQAVQKGSQQAFKNKYRNNVDVLLIDDIHEFHSKESTQDELFHTFNALYDANKQMVFTIDRPPSELVNFANRLKSRFEMGLNVDLQPPNYETRLAILKNMNENSNSNIPEEVMELISRNITTNIRDLKAALTKLIAYAELVGKNITLEIAQNQLKQAFNAPIQANITIDRVQRIVSEYFNITPNDLKGKKRTKVITYPRQICMYIIREITDFSTTEIGLEFGGRDHTTVMHSCQRIEDRMKTDSTLEPLVMNLIRSVKEHGNN